MLFTDFQGLEVVGEHRLIQTNSYKILTQQCVITHAGRGGVLDSSSINNNKIILITLNYKVIISIIIIDLICSCSKFCFNLLRQGKIGKVKMLYFN